MTMETINWALIGVAAIIGLCAWKGKKAGFIKAAFSALSTLASIIGTIFVGPIVYAMFGGNKIFAYVLTFIIISIGLSVACTVLDIVAKLPVLHQINSTAGLLVGLADGLLKVWIVFIVLDLFADTEWGSLILALISQNEFLASLYQNNILLTIWNIL